MIIVWFIAAIGGVSFFFLLLPDGWTAALIGAPVCASALTALAAVALAWLRRSSAGRDAGAPKRDAAHCAGPSRAMQRSGEWPN